MRSSSQPSARAERKLNGVEAAPRTALPTAPRAALALGAVLCLVLGSVALSQEPPTRQALRDAQSKALPVVLAALVDLDIRPQSFIRPVQARISSYFGWRNVAVNGNRHHAGIDLAAQWGTPVRAARDGIVERAGWWGTYGNAVAIDHGDASETRYAHLSSVAVAAGQLVRQGDVIGYVGSTGASTGPHLHFELRFDGRAVDPLGYLVDDTTAAR